ncbi:undecaprenyl-phosphate glucose phosphotransferase [Aestuariivirga sp.]|uniref:undecaprenyl-phosphate glucose phosphotransferase n=1 Tax=Aestuariivirga sp. TaxID=2650926 RepID=UPI003593F59A
MGIQAGARMDRYVDREIVQRILKFLDAGVLFAASIFISLLSATDLSTTTPQVIGFLAIELSLVCVFAMRSFGLYDVGAMTQGPWTALRATAISFMLGGLLYLLTHRFLLEMDFGWMYLWMMVLPAYFGITRVAVSLWAAPRAAEGRFRQRVAIVGGGRSAEDALNLLESSTGLDIEIIGLFDDRDDARSPQSIRAYHKIGRIEELAQYARSQRVDLIVVAIPLSAETRLLTILKRLWELPVDIRISGQSSSLKLNARAYTYLGKLPLLSVFDRPLKGWQLIQKEALDRVLSVLMIIALAPVMLGVALAVKLESKGPVIFRQKRYGFNNELIEVFKFRSMYTDRCDASAAKLVTKDDPRVTKVGRFIRRTSLDELPQLFNVLLGQLSLVGPRPHATQAKAADALYETVVDGYFARHRVKPGITGWAQINGWRGETDTRDKLEQRVKHDLEYIDRWSMGFDLYIILKTPIVLLRGENAY